MSHAADRPFSNPGSSQSREDEGGCLLVEAAALFSAGAGADEAEPGTSDALGDRQAAEQGLIEPWIVQHELWMGAAQFNELLLGGTEHDVERIGDPVTHVRRVTKATDVQAGKGHGFMPAAVGGLHLGPASLGHYLKRLVLLNEIFPEVTMRLEGFLSVSGRIEVVTRQEYVSGRILSDLAVDIGKQEMTRFVERGFTKRGFAKLYLPSQVGPSHAWYRADDNTALFDAKPANLMEQDGQLFPIDVNPVRPAGLLQRLIRACL